MTAEEIDGLFDSFNQLRIMVIGDVMIDSYMWGKVNRISPEAPVPIVAVDKLDNRLGGAANVALNLQALGATPLIYAVIGDDEKGNLFMKLLKEQSLSDEGMIQSSDRKTTVKTRVLSGGNQILRVDEEIETDLNDRDEQALTAMIASALESGQVDAIIFEDYDKGLITEGLIKAVSEKASALDIAVTVDPKKKNFDNYQTVSLFKPNLKEIREGMKVDIYQDNIGDIEGAVGSLIRDKGHKLVLVTLSELGVYIGGSEVNDRVLAHYRDITDVSGAGDTVISVATLCLVMNTEPKFIASISNLAGGIVCEKVGVTPINRDQLLKEAKALLAE
jgi:rfaE bifunctional protein kinase chain/domain